jgi:mono/diheme cytochrome c family protein
VKLVIAVLALAACDNGGSWPDWSRMIDQPKVLPFGETAMRTPPRGTIAYGEHAPTVAATLTAIPVPITRALLERGRGRFAIVCAACHGTRGDGDSPVAHAMQRRRPPSFAEREPVLKTVGELYIIIRDGDGYMPSYAAMLDDADRWAVVAYVRTLQLAQGAQLARSP